MPVIPAFRSWRHKNQLKAILSYKLSCRIAWATWDPVFKKKKKKKTKKQKNKKKKQNPQKKK